ncbi:uncharacterized protein LOC135837038 [Planococcus citri]|uniref:uncharacterized protein LOC135837038 n=1 Tax=Planococcus citri TaxID=170843 RepID=UPI0031F9CBB6
MTMDVYQRTIRADSSPPISVDDFRDLPPTSSPTSLLKKPAKPAKRSFDVAFLMAPDDLSKKRHHHHQDDKPNPIIVKKPYKYSPPANDTGDIYHRTSYNNIDGQYQINPLSLTIHQDKLPRDDIHSPDTLLVEQKENPFFVRSAFTKVTSGTGLGGGNFQLNTSLMSRTPPIAVSPSSVSSTASNRSGLSPDLTYQDSLSPQPFQPLNRSPVQILPGGVGGGPASVGKSPYHHPHNANLQYFVAASQLGNNHLLKDIKSEEKLAKFGPGSDYDEPANSASSSIPSKHKSKQLLPPSTKQNFPYHADNLSIPYTGFPMSTFPFTPTLAPAAASASVPIFPTAAANLTAALLPPSFAALTLPAQNVCAKCNMHFRMTSDLVYHMRSHHKNDTNVVDPYKRRRDQDKLKCPVCNESFRERHHLTRHMTAHQDKDEDDERNKDFVDVTLQRPISSGSSK